MTRVKTTKVYGKWFYDALNKAHDLLIDCYPHARTCNWQEVGENRVIECYNCYPTANSNPVTVFVTIQKNEGLREPFVMVWDAKLHASTR